MTRWMAAGALASMLVVVNACADSGVVTESAAVASPDAATVARIAAACASSHSLRVTVGAHAFDLIRPRIGVDGISYARVEGFPRPRPALIVSSHWDTVPPPPRPIAWRDVRAIERPVTQRTPGAITGAVLGALAFGWGGYSVSNLVRDEHLGPSFTIAGAMGGAGIGALIGAGLATTVYVREYPPPTPADAPH